MRTFFSLFLSFSIFASAVGSSPTAESISNDSSQYALEKGVQYFQGIGVPCDIAKAVVYFRQAANLGNTEACVNLGFMYDLGIGLENDYLQAASWYQKAAKQGNATAQFNLGILYRFGRGVEQDCKTAAMWYTKAAEQGYIDAQYNLGILFEEGRGVEKDPLAADKWYILAAASDHSGAIARHEALAVKLSPTELQKAWESAFEWGVNNVAYADENA